MQNVCKVVVRDLRKGKTMSDYINIKKLKKKKVYSFQTVFGLSPKNEWFYKYDDIHSIPSADVRPNIHGHWKRRTHIGNHETVTMYVCSECDTEFGWDIETGIPMNDNNFCPNCGADMREPKREKTKDGI